MHVAAVKFKGKMYLGEKRNREEGLATRAQIARLTVEQAPARAVSAKVEVGWHDSDSDTKDHCTVDYKIGGNTQITFRAGGKGPGTLLLSEPDLPDQMEPR
ncbi:hypothetical protein FPCIR_2175 [Fusarium pseudocircinatum]|uniref:Uncharacterized protein n=1 Tax=Fusarium pseudocircinatum TaxID=56676 RepID=A0A8H5UWE1_9HYPO|nr:hypothetical protein FPCIR_2175 [Fusarium pseudocircinatum]